MSDATRFAKDELKTVIERIERLEEEKAATMADIREVYAEAKGSGFDVKAIRTIVKLRKQDADKRREEEAVLERYMHALGMLFDADVDLGRRPEPARKGRDDDMKVTISVPGSDIPPVETTTSEIERASDSLKTLRGQRALKRAVATATEAEHTASLVNPKHLPSEKTVSEIADRAEQRSASCDIPPILKRGHPECLVQEHPPPNGHPP